MLLVFIKCLKDVWKVYEDFRWYVLKREKKLKGKFIFVKSNSNMYIFKF